MRASNKAIGLRPSQMVLPFAFAFFSLLTFAAGWYFAFDARAISQAQGLTASLLPIFFTSVMTILANIVIYERLLNDRYKLGPYKQGILVGIVNLLAIAVSFTVVTFLVSSFSHGSAQWGGLSVYVFWILSIGCVPSVVLGLLFGLALQRWLVQPDQAP